ncbi:MAG: DUF4013 domain-containing protein [Methanobrevibacter sp.]|nr:DUF4013 domain-containing protein [Methanobrevibacter sp.]
MKISEILINSLKYPMDDEENFKYVMLFSGILVVGSLLYSLMTGIGFCFGSNAASALIIIGALLYAVCCFAYGLVFPGYLISVIREGIDQTGVIPAFEFGQNIVDTIKFWILGFIYNIVPIIVTVIVVVIFAFVGGSFTSTPSAGSPAVLLIIIAAIILAVVFVFFNLLFAVGALRFAKYESLSEALSISECWAELKEVGLKLVLLVVAIAVIQLGVVIASLLLWFIPVVGLVISTMIVIPFTRLFGAYALGSLYSEV